MTLGGAGGAAAVPYPPYGGVFASSPAPSLAVADGRRRRRGRACSVARCGIGGGSAKGGPGAEDASGSAMGGRLDGVLAGGGEDDEEDGNPRKRKKRGYRHTPHQIQELEAFFKENERPKQQERAELSKRLGLEPRQVTCWFVHRRTRPKCLTRLSLLHGAGWTWKNRMEHHNKALLKQVNDKLRVENLSTTMSSHLDVVSIGGGEDDNYGKLRKRKRQYRRFMPQQINQFEAFSKEIEHPDEKQRADLAMRLGVEPSQVQYWFQYRRKRERKEHTQLNQEDNMLHAEILSIQGGMRDLALLGEMPVSTISELAGSVPSQMGTVTMPVVTIPSAMISIDKFVFVQLAMRAMDELVKMAQINEPLWIPIVSSPGSPTMETLNWKEYLKMFSLCVGAKPNGFVSEASRDSGIVAINSGSLVEVFMNERRWSDMFSCIVAKASTIQEITAGAAGTRDGALLLMQAELQVLSPLVPRREVTFLRFCNQLAEGVWAVVDVSVDGLERDQCLVTNMNCRRLPSGCVVQETPNGCKVTWVEHTEYHEASVHQLYQPLLRSGLALGAGRWLATLQRQCACLATLMSSVTVPEHDSSAVPPEGKWNLMKLSQRMMEDFCAGVGASSAEWSKVNGLIGSMWKDIRVMVRISVDEPGVPPGVVLSAATAVWMPVTPEQLFNFLCNEGLRAEWDILGNGPVQQMVHIAKGQLDGNSVTLLRADPRNTDMCSMLILQETCIDKSGAMVVYAPVEFAAMQLVMCGGDSANVALLPSGFAILPGGSCTGGGGHETSGSLLTVAFQILVNSQPTAKITVESMDTVNSLISCTIEKIKKALHREV
ncbi:unnamed protein product [Urochloa decumbens]|uniref:Uncharacterized protein n=1 Tax=Urochloa decumbens TaxID=240449 RepID=A0ABC9C5Z8_9POAL